MIGNILIELRGNVAAVESYFRTTLEGRTAEDKPRETLLARRYIDRFERRNGEWREAARTVVYDWARHTSLESEVDSALFGSRQPVGGHQPHDTLYELLEQTPFVK